MILKESGIPSTNTFGTEVAKGRPGTRGGTGSGSCCFAGRVEESRIVIVRSAPWASPPMALIDDLHRYYEGNGILATQFTCQHEAECRGGSPSFTGSNSAFVGERYEDAHRCGLPRLLFVSLDSGSGEPDSEKRVPHAVRSYTKERCLGWKNRHW